ncbi:head-tail adaptor [Serratia sp. UGAL515B_01]|uniref:head-tail adaptor n=1 Tax=Serratia sp. UGAL515B_01 TaxID=2986763 RepID=UPI0029547E18|nr:head-tail adaptor [Serratia sp. UGAL515B_01]WON76312.1 head-tail adaptor [Serratia sp. UGAL515B_01]
MPLLDVTDILLDADFADSTLEVTRNWLMTDDDGVTRVAQQSMPFTGVVMVDHSLMTQRMPPSQTISGSIQIITLERLTQGQSGRDADIVTYQGRDYRVTFVDPYLAYGAGFVLAHCELMPFDGGGADEQQR